MKRIKTAREIEQQGQIGLDFNVPLNPADSALPRPLGATRSRRMINLLELAKLEATRAAGGLVADDGTRAVWICSNCGRITNTQTRAWYCHRAEPRLIRICVRCEKELGRCRCSERNHVNPSKLTTHELWLKT